MLEKLALLTGNAFELAGDSSTLEQLSIPTESRRKTFVPLQLEIKIQSETQLPNRPK